MISKDSLLYHKLDEYRIETLLGKGGMARVYRALDERLNRYVALKVIEKPFRADADYVTRFEREARAIARLEHEHIVRLYRFGQAEGLMYIAMQFIDGINLEKIMDLYRADGEFMLIEDICRIVSEVCQALDYAHSQGVIHRDLKPSNVMLDKKGKVYLTDFGLAMLSDVTTRGQVLGSPRYVSPEQAISSANVVPQSDLYSVGVILYEMLTGRVPFDGSKPLDVAIMHIEEQLPPPRELRPSLSTELEDILFKILKKRPEDRYQSGSEFSATLEHAIFKDKDRTQISGISPSDKSVTLAERVKFETALKSGTLKEVASPQPPAIEESIDSATPSPENQKSKPLPIMLGAGVLALILIVVMCISLIVLVQWASGLRSQNEIATISPTTMTSQTVDIILIVNRTKTPTPLLTETSFASQNDNETLTSTITATETIHVTENMVTSWTQTPSPTATQTATVIISDNFKIIISTKKDDSLVVINDGEEPFTLSPLQLGDGSDAIKGTEWLVNDLLPGECVVAVKDTGRPKLPKNKCDEIGERIFRSQGARFWEDSFKVYYNEIEIGTCEPNKNGIECEIEFGD
ncbi:MAG: protein kinase [Anaerolineales bacterium]